MTTAASARGFGMHGLQAARGTKHARRQSALLGRWLPATLVVLVLCRPVWAEAQRGGRSITDRSVDWPTWAQWQRVLTLQDHNTRVVVLGTALLGLSAGLIGSFMLLRKRALMGDALSHATLPGIGLAFIVAVALGQGGKSLPALLAGAIVSGVMGVGCILVLRQFTRLKEDTALGIVLSVFFGAGVAVLGVVQQMSTGHAAGLESFIYGKTASMIGSDAAMIGAAGAIVALVCALLYKEFALLCFDQGYARSQGWPVMLLDLLLMSLVVTVTVIGLQAVGLILIIALLIIPAAAARFWTERMFWMIVAAAIIGAISCMLGAAMSALFPRLPSGAMIVVVATVVFGISMLFGRARGVLPHWLAHRQLSLRIARQHLLRALYESIEVRLGRERVLSATDAAAHPMPLEELLLERSWSARQLMRTLRRAQGEYLIVQNGAGAWALTEQGVQEAQRVVRNHRLWETFLVHHADVAPSHVDRDADMIEHVLSREMIEQLERLLDQDETRAAAADSAVPASPHPLVSPH